MGCGGRGVGAAVVVPRQRWAAPTESLVSVWVLMTAEAGRAGGAGGGGGARERG